MRSKIEDIYRKLYRHCGPQHWWPGRGAFEVMVGAILTQNTNWENVEKAITNLRKNKLLDARRMHKLPLARLSRTIRPAGYYNVKARRLKNFLRFFVEDYGADIKKISKQRTAVLRKQLLDVNGIGPETADSILLYALDKPVFVVDAYTKRFLVRHKMAGKDDDYHVLQKIFTQNLKKDVKLFNEYHALIVRLGKEFCRKTRPKCDICPLKKSQK